MRQEGSRHLFPGVLQLFAAVRQKSRQLPHLGRYRRILVANPIREFAHAGHHLSTASQDVPACFLGRPARLVVKAPVDQPARQVQLMDDRVVESRHFFVAHVVEGAPCDRFRLVEPAVLPGSR